MRGLDHFLIIFLPIVFGIAYLIRPPAGMSRQDVRKHQRDRVIGGVLMAIGMMSAWWILVE